MTVSNRARSSWMGRPPLNIKPTLVRLSGDVRERIRKLVGDSGMAGFIREAIEHELERRERPKHKRPAKDE